MLIGTGISALGGFLGGRSQEKLTKEQLAQQSRQFDATLAENKRQTNLQQGNTEQARIDQLGQTGLEVQQQTPNRVGWRQNQAMLAAIMPELRNASVSSGIPGMNAFIPQISGGLRIPEGGFSPSTLKFFGDNAMLTGETDLDRQGQIASGGRMAIPDYAAVYGPQAGATAGASVSALQEQLKADEEKRRQQRQAIMLGALGTAMSPSMYSAPYGSIERERGNG